MTSTPVISGKKLTPKNKRLREDLEHRLNRWMQESSNKVNAAIAGAKTKLPGTKPIEYSHKADSEPDGDDLETELLLGGKKIPKEQAHLIRALALLGFNAINWEQLADIFKPYLSAAYVEGVDVGVGHLQMSNAGQHQADAEETAEEYADRRSAELAGMKRQADGELVQDPDALHPLTTVINRDLERTISQAVVEGWTQTQLDAVIDATYAFSPERTTIIADTEVTNAQSGGTYSLWRESGVVTLVRWRTSDRHDQDDECDDYEEQGVVPLGHEFAEGLFSPRAHPFCLCSLEVVDPNEVFDSIEE